MSAEAARRYDPEPLPSDPGDGSPEAFLDAIRYALETEHAGEARRLAERAVLFYPEHDKVRQMYLVLTPGRARIVPRGKRIPNSRPSFEWIRKHAAEYRRQWIAVAGGELIAVSEDFEDLLRQVREVDPKFSPILHFVE